MFCPIGYLKSSIQASLKTPVVYRTLSALTHLPLTPQTLPVANILEL